MQKCDDPRVWRQWLEEIKLPTGETVADLAETVEAVLRRWFDPAMADHQKLDQRHRAESFWGLKSPWFDRWLKAYGQLGDQHTQLLSWLAAGGPAELEKSSVDSKSTRRAS